LFILSLLLPFQRARFVATRLPLLILTRRISSDRVGCTWLATSLGVPPVTLLHLSVGATFS